MDKAKEDTVSTSDSKRSPFKLLRFGPHNMGLLQDRHFRAGLEYYKEFIQYPDELPPLIEKEATHLTLTTSKIERIKNKIRSLKQRKQALKRNCSHSQI